MVDLKDFYGIPSWSVPSRIEKARCGDLPYRAITVAHVPVQ